MKKGIILGFLAIVATWGAYNFWDGQTKTTAVSVDKYAHLREQVAGKDYRTDSMIVKFREGIDTVEKAEATLAQINPAQPKAHVIFRSTDPRVIAKVGSNRIYGIDVGEDEDIFATLALYRASSNIEYANLEIDHYQPAFTPDDTSYHEQWSHINIDSEQAWDISTGTPSTTIAIIDAGFFYGIGWSGFPNDDMDSNLWINTAETPDDDIDNDGNGCVDDIYGCNFMGVTTITEDGLGIDNGIFDTGVGSHGTSVAGAAVAAENEPGDEGAVGVCFNCSAMYIVRDISMTRAIAYAVDNGADVINISLAGSYSKAVEDAIDYAYESDVPIIAAAGNNGNSTPLYPAALEHVLAVAGSWPDDDRASGDSGSNYGSWIDIAAPWETWVTTWDLGATTTLRGGTSISSPIVAGVVGLVKSEHPEFTVEQIYSLIRSAATTTISSEHIGTGIVDAYQSLQYDDIPEASFKPYLDDATISGQSTITVIGTATSTSFDQYKVKYGSGVYPSNYTLFATSSSRVTSSTLATWDLYEVPNGYYTLKLIADDTFGNKAIDMTYLQTDANDCSGGIDHAQCGTTKPKYCSNGTFYNDCDICGCRTGFYCYANGTCGSTLPDIED